MSRPCAVLRNDTFSDQINPLEPLERLVTGTRGRSRTPYECDSDSSQTASSPREASPSREQMWSKNTKNKTKKSEVFAGHLAASTLGRLDKQGWEVMQSQSQKFQLPYGAVRRAASRFPSSFATRSLQPIVLCMTQLWHYKCLRYRVCMCTVRLPGPSTVAAQSPIAWALASDCTGTRQEAISRPSCSSCHDIGPSGSQAYGEATALCRRVKTCNDPLLLRVTGGHAGGEQGQSRCPMAPLAALT